LKFDKKVAARYYFFTKEKIDNRMIMKKCIIAILFLMFVNGFNFGEPDNSTKIQLRIKNGEATDQNLKDLKLFVNKKEINISGIVKTERYINKERLLGRNFVLTFMNFDKFDKVLEDAISYFVTEVLEKSDSLIVHTNINIHQIKVTENKERMILNISNRLKRDMNYEFKKSSRILKSINTEISKMERFFGSYSPSSAILVGGAQYFKFFASIIPDILFYKNEFIIPDKKKFKEIHDLLGYREGDRYWIFIQNGNVYPFTGRVHKTIKAVRSFLSRTTTGDSSWSKLVGRKIREMQDSMLVAGPYPESSMSEGFINTNTSFFTILYSPDDSSSDKKTGLQLSEILKKLSEDTGGAFVETSNIESGINGVREHKDTFWDIMFELPDEKGKLKLRIESGVSKKELFYRKRFKDKELEELKKYLLKAKISIEDQGFQDNILSFSIRYFTLSKRGGFGLLKVIIQLYDNAGKEVYRRSKTLRAEQKKINISTGIPAEFSSGHNMRVSVLDMISNRLIVKEIKMN